MKKIIMIGLLLTGCTMSLQEVSTNLSTKWAGRSYDEFIMEHGIAKANQKLQNGMTMYMWEETKIMSTGQYSSSAAPCTLNILVDANGEIKSIKASSSDRVCDEIFNK